MTDTDEWLSRVCGENGYPPEWPAVSLATKIEAGFRCVRCGHPNGRFVQAASDPELTARVLAAKLGTDVLPRVYHVEGGAWIRHHLIPCDELCAHDPRETDHRILTVHHLDGVKPHLSWFNLCALCQRCHLTIQGKVVLDQAYLHPHSPWFYPYVGGYYAATVLGLTTITRDEVLADLPRFLAAGQPHLADYYASTLTRRG